MSSTTNVTNRTVLGRINPELFLEGKITKQKLAYFKHVMRTSSLQKTVLLHNAQW
jgi:hypothetical protein